MKHYLLDTNTISYLADSSFIHKEKIKSHLNVIALDINEIEIFGKLKTIYKENTGIKNEANKKMIWIF